MPGVFWVKNFIFEELKFDGVRRSEVRRSDSKFEVTKKMKGFYDAIKIEYS